MRCKTTQAQRRADSGSSVSFLNMLLFLFVLRRMPSSQSRIPTAAAFQTHGLNRHRRRLQGLTHRNVRCFGSKNENGDSTGTTEDMNLLTKSSWYAVEWFGNAFGKSESSSDTAVSQSATPPKSLEETVRRINADNDRYYFLSGEIDSYIYDADCVFADPFVSFSGRDRFVENLQNLGSFITKYDARVLKYSPVRYENSIPIIETKIMVKLELNLPWKPVLAWPWGVKYEIDPDTFLITNHEESWNIEPLEGVKMIFRPATVKL
mmetsp:Transcript_22269/g.49374  ORF Transcript_22269/g.49374 Transcript_22269/m.49374 type:complete len:264 (+) Transcript_22269:62-853(+)